REKIIDVDLLNKWRLWNSLIHDHPQALKCRNPGRRPAERILPHIAEVKIIEQRGAECMDLADVRIVNARAGAIGITRVIMRVVDGSIRKVVDKKTGRQPVILAKRVVHSHDALVEVLTDAGLEGIKTRAGQTGGQHLIGEGHRDRIELSDRDLLVR